MILTTANAVSGGTLTPLQIALIAGASGAVIEGGGEFIDELHEGEPINWGAVAARTVGGGAKGAMFSVPGLGTAKLAAGTVGIATAENYLHSAAKGDVSAEALGKALADGTIEGVTAGLVDVAAKKVLGAHVHSEIEPAPYLDPYEMLEEHGIPTTLSEEQRAACDAVGLEMKYKPSEMNFDSINKTPYNPRAMEEMLQKEGQEISSSTLPKLNQPNVKLAGRSIERTIVIDSATGETAIQRIVFDERGFPIFDPYVKVETRITGNLHLMDRETHMRAATRQLRSDIDSGKVNKSLFSERQLMQIKQGKRKIEGFTWHHHQDCGRM